MEEARDCRWCFRHAGQRVSFCSRCGREGAATGPSGTGQDSTPVRAAVSTGPISTNRFRAYPASPMEPSDRSWWPKDRRAVPSSTTTANKFGVAPDVQLGYIAPFADGAWLAGIKFTYKDANNNSKENVAISQTGSFTTVGGVTVNFVGFVPILPADGQSEASTCAHSHHWPRVRQGRDLCRCRPRIVWGPVQVQQWGWLCRDRRVPVRCHRCAGHGLQ